MTNLISRAFSGIRSVFEGLQVKRFLAVALVGFLLLTTNVESGRASGIVNKIDKLVHQGESDRPKTMGDFQEEVSGDVPVEKRVENTVRDSAEAFEDFGELYPDTAKRSSRQLRDDTK